MDAGGASAGAGAARLDHPSAQSPAIRCRRDALGCGEGDAGAGDALPTRRRSTRSCGCSAMPAPRRSSGRGRSGCATSSGRDRGLPREPAELRLPAAGADRAGRAAMIDRIVAGFREPIHCDDVPIDTRIGDRAQGARASPAAARREDLRAALAAAQDSRGTPKGWAWFDRKSDDAHRRAFRLLSDLKAALANEGQLELHYQPKVGLGSGACDSAEALLRWTHPELGAGLARRVRRARRDDGAGHADDALGDRRGDAAGGDLGGGGARHLGGDQRLAEEPRGAGLRRVPAVLLHDAADRPGAGRARGDRGRAGGAGRADPGPAGGAAQARLLDRDRRLRLGLFAT